MIIPFTQLVLSVSPLFTILKKAEYDFCKQTLEDENQKVNKDIFDEILASYYLRKEEVIVIKDDRDSEIQAVIDLHFRFILVDLEEKFDLDNAV